MAENTNGHNPRDPKRIRSGSIRTAKARVALGEDWQAEATARGVVVRGVEAGGETMNEEEFVALIEKDVADFYNIYVVCTERDVEAKAKAAIERLCNSGQPMSANEIHRSGQACIDSVGRREALNK